jgi:hypothetical protein
MAVSQKVQRQPAASETTPPMIGPQTGAINGIIPMSARALPRDEGVNMSPTMQVFSTVEATVEPSTKRHPISMLMLVLHAATMEKTMKRIFEI